MVNVGISGLMKYWLSSQQKEGTHTFFLLLHTLFFELGKYLHGPPLLLFPYTTTRDINGQAAL